ncbi:MAG: nucleotidyltransferase domain-containing protein [Magnetococcales bacterium]|nr:nucleotidyltransferase domain-containing protein [Magnetococcales bacterium]
MIDSETIQAAGRLLSETAGQARVILFGSYARGDAREDSDLDFLVIQPLVTDRLREMTRLRQALRPLRVPVDILLCSIQEMAELGNLSNGVIHWALREGVTVHDTLG